MSMMIGSVPNEIGDEIAIGFDDEDVLLMIGNHPAGRFSVKDSDDFVNYLRIAVENAEAYRQLNESSW
jgi:hypothetical protein